jgi:hypothetical protein
MTQLQFKELELSERMEVINQNGLFASQRSYYNHDINLYTLFGFFVEVWYANFENRISKIQIVQRPLVDKFYLEKIDISSLLN